MIREIALFHALGSFLYDRACSAPGAVADRLLDRAARWHRAAQEPEHVHDHVEGLRVTPRPDPEQAVEGIAGQVTGIGVAHTSIGIVKVALRGELMRASDWLMESIEKAKHVEIEVDSIGGCANVARRILAALISKSCSVHVPALAGSASALITILCPGRRTMAPDSMLCMHSPTVVSIGTPAQLRQTADRLETETAEWISRLARRTGRSKEECAVWLGADDTWFDAEQCVERGLVDAISDE